MVEQETEVGEMNYAEETARIAGEGIREEDNGTAEDMPRSPTEIEDACREALNRLAREYGCVVRAEIVPVMAAPDNSQVSHAARLVCKYIGDPQ